MTNVILPAPDHTTNVIAPHAKRPGRLRNGNPSGNPHLAPRCGARTRAGAPCRSPAMKNGRCRMHGGTSTGARTAVGRLTCRLANLRHGLCTEAYAEEKRMTRQISYAVHGMLHLARKSIAASSAARRSARKRRNGASQPMQSENAAVGATAASTCRSAEATASPGSNATICAAVAATCRSAAPGQNCASQPTQSDTAPVAASIALPAGEAASARSASNEASHLLQSDDTALATLGGQRADARVATAAKRRCEAAPARPHVATLPCRRRLAIAPDSRSLPMQSGTTRSYGAAGMVSPGEVAAPAKAALFTGVSALALARAGALA
jgi:hypothetical protein